MSGLREAMRSAIQRTKSYCHRGGPDPLLGATIPEHFAHIARQFQSREAVASPWQQRRLTYGELSQAVDDLACGLLALGFSKGDRIGIWSTNSIEWLLLQMATAKIGAILVTVNPAYRVRELAYALEHSKIQAVFTIPSFKSSDYVAMLVELIGALKEPGCGPIESKDFPALRRIVVYNPKNPAKTERVYPGFTLWPEVLDAGRDVSREDLERHSTNLDRDDPINIQYTSGTTGFPKAVVLSHHNILNNAYFAAKAMHFTERDRLCIPLPFYHCFGMVLSSLLCLSVGACAVIACEQFDPLAVLQAVETERCTALHGVPTMFIAELDHPEFEDFDLSSLRTGIMAGAPCPPALMKRIIQQMHCPEILIGYGETEASPLTHLTTRMDTFQRRIGTVGRNLPHQEVKIVDLASQQTVPVGTIGEICFRGYHIMKGYYGDPAATADAVDENGWLYSGDMGVMDADGYVQITGRRKEMIIRGGENIYPREIEDFIFTHPKVAQVAVFGVPDEFYGEAVMAWVACHAGQSVTEDEIRAYCRDHIAHFKIPQRVWFVDAFPMTVTGKLQKFRMRDLTRQKLSEEKPV